MAEVKSGRTIAPITVSSGLRPSLRISSQLRSSGRRVLAARLKPCVSWITFFKKLVLLLLTLVLVPALAQTGGERTSPVDPLPEDRGIAGLNQMLLRLHTTARLLHTTAHPDDEDGGILTLESRGKGVTEILLTLNRGEGGQNKVGSNLFDVLGVLRTLELTASDRYYGVEQRFTRVADFGFSKSAQETLEKWGGHDVALGDLVRVIRTFRPEVIVSRFQGSDRDGHGNHQVSGILSREAFRAAGDRNRFPEQIQEGLEPWQAKKLYVDNVCPFRSDSCEEENYTIKLNVGEFSPALGMSYIEFAMHGLKHQLSQGAGSWSVGPGPHYAFYKLVDSVLSNTLDNTGHEKDFFDGIDTSLVNLASRLGNEEAKVPFFKAGLARIQNDVEVATVKARKNALSAIDPLVEGKQSILELSRQIKASPLSSAAKNAVLPLLELKASQFVQAIALSAGVKFDVFADVPPAQNPDDAFMAVPGQTFNVTATYSTEDPSTKALDISLDLLPNWQSKLLSKEEKGNQYVARFKVNVPPDAEYTRPYFDRKDPETDSIYTIADPRYQTLPFPPLPLRAIALAGKAGVITSLCMVKYKDADGNQAKRALAVAPPFSIALQPAIAVIPIHHSGNTEIKVGVRSNIVASGNLRLELPAGWSAEPNSQAVNFLQAGESKNFVFQVRPSNLREERSEIKAVLDYRGKSYDLGYSVVTRPDLDTFYYYQPALQRVSILDVNIPKDLKVGYIMGAGDDIPTVLNQIGMDVTLIPADQLGSQDLSGYATVVLGIRAYDTQKAVAERNQQLLDYVAGGGTLIVQYNTGVGEFNSGHFTPYPAQLSRARVSVEQAPVEILAPEDGIFHYPNQITQKDFDSWVQERGLYFMDQWDTRFKPLLSCHDPGEEPKKGGLLEAHYGKGRYIYTGYAFFRQLPAGVPGAIRLYVNLLSAGHENPSSAVGPFLGRWQDEVATAGVAPALPGP